MIDQGIIQKIKKLLALASSDNENEAQAAMMKAQELLAKHKLTIRDVNDVHEESKVIEKQTAVTFKKATWKGRLSSVIASNFCCYNYYYTDKTHRVSFMGLPEDVETAVSVFEYAVEYITGRTRQLTGQGVQDEAGGDEAPGKTHRFDCNVNIDSVDLDPFVRTD